jgi:hypothetical protein
MTRTCALLFPGAALLAGASLVAAGMALVPLSLSLVAAIVLAARIAGPSEAAAAVEGAE